jgi:hypothetical protein
MATQSNPNRPGVTPLRRFSILAALLALDGFILGGLVALLIVNRLLTTQLGVYVAANNMAAASAILDFMDDLVPSFFCYGAALLVAVLLTASVWTWLSTRSRAMRLGIVLLSVLILLVLGAIWLSRGSGGAAVPPTTPTPTIGAWLVQ